jgi:predicted dehydrogenase
VKVLLAGTGSIGRRHVHSIQSLDPSASFLVLRASGAEDDFSRALRATVVRNLLEALQLAPDCVVVATPSHLHAGLVSDVLAARLPAYVEKPVVVRRAELEQLEVALAANREVPTLCGCNLRFLPSLRRLRELLAEGAIGRVVRASLQVGQWLPDWRPQADYRQSYSASAQRGGGVVLDLVHEFDAARWLLGEFDQVVALGGRRSRLEIDAEDVAIIALGSRTGPLAAIGLDYVARRPLRRYELVGEEGTLTWDLPERRLEVATADGVRAVPLAPDAFDVAATYPRAMGEFLAAVRSGRQTSQGLEEGLRSAALAIRANEVIRA